MKDRVRSLEDRVSFCEDRLDQVQRPNGVAAALGRLVRDFPPPRAVFWVSVITLGWLALARHFS